MKKKISTATYILNKPNEKPFGGIKGYIYLPEYSTEIKFFFFDKKIDYSQDIYLDNAKVYNLDLEELEILNQGSKFIEINIKVLIDQIKRKRLKDDVYQDYGE